MTDTNYDYLIGLTLEKAQDALAENGSAIRVVRCLNADGHAYFGTMDYRIDRINVSTTDGVISAVGNVG